MAIDNEEGPYPTIDIPPELTSVPDVVTFMVNHLAIRGEIRPENSGKIISHVLKREWLGSTAIGNGVAIPHAGNGFIESATVLVGRSSGIDWPGERFDGSIRLVYLVLTPVDQPGTAFRIMQAIREAHRL